MLQGFEGIKINNLNNKPSNNTSGGSGIRYLKSSPNYKPASNEKQKITDYSDEGYYSPSSALAPNLNTGPSFTYQMNTKNASFIKMHDILDRLGIENNKFFLILYDKRLLNIDPYDKTLTAEEQLIVAKECSINYFYFIREVARIPAPGSKLGIGGGIPYELNRGNLALSFCLLNNYNIWVELPRQMGKTFGAAGWYLWLHNFGTSNSEFLFMNKAHSDATNNLKRLKDMRDLIPEYLQFLKTYNPKTGGYVENPNNVEFIENLLTKNKIVTKPSANSKERANNIGRGMTQPSQWYDEFAFLVYNMVIYKAATPANSQASAEAKKNNKPYGRIISTTPGDLETDCGRDAYTFLHGCAKFTEAMYDWSPKRRDKFILKNSRNNFIFIQYHWYQLGKNKEWFDNQIRELDYDWVTIRREILLEWINASSRSIFDQEEILELRNNIREPMEEAIFMKVYPVQIYNKPDHRYKVIMSIDVATGASRDSSSITVIDPRTYMPLLHFNSNVIDINELSRLVINIVENFCPNCLIVPERNGAGEGLVANLKNSKVRNSLYFEYKRSGSKTDERMKDGFKAESPKNTISYGVWNDGPTRTEIVELVYRMVKKHKEKFIVEQIVKEISTLVSTKTGRIEHDQGCHDDSVFSYFLGVWALLYGTNLNAFGILRFPLESTTDEDLEERREEREKAYNNFMTADDEIFEDEDNSLVNKIEKKDMKEFYKQMEDERKENLVDESSGSNNMSQHKFDSAFFDFMNT